MNKQGSMTSEILAETLRKLVELNVYPRTQGDPIPCCLFDAHDTHLQIPLLEYANKEN